MSHSHIYSWLPYLLNSLFKNDKDPSGTIFNKLCFVCFATSVWLLNEPGFPIIAYSPVHGWEVPESLFTIIHMRRPWSLTETSKCCQDCLSHHGRQWELCVNKGPQWAWPSGQDSWANTCLPRDPVHRGLERKACQQSAVSVGAAVESCFQNLGSLRYGAGSFKKSSSFFLCEVRSEMISGNFP